LLVAVVSVAVWQLAKRDIASQQVAASGTAQAAATPKEPSGKTSEPAATSLWTAVRSVSGSRPASASSTGANGAQKGGVPGTTPSFEVTATMALADLHQGSQVRIPLPGGETATGVVNLVQVDPAGTVRVGGTLTGATGGSFSLGETGGRINGRVLLPQKKTAYLITSSGAGRMQLQQLPLTSVVCYPFPREPKPSAPAQAGSPGPQSTPPLLSSRPSATAVLYLDFDGATVTDPDWPAYAADGVTITGPTIVAPASSLTNAEITEVWNRVKEDYWPFNIDITTDPNRYNNAPLGQRMRVIITPNDAAAPGAGGVAYVGSFTLSGSPYFYFQSDNPAWVFNTTVDGVAEAISHETRPHARVAPRWAQPAAGRILHRRWRILLRPR